MSYDITVSYDECIACGHAAASFEWDPTYNLAPMWDAAGLRMRDLHGMSALEAAPVVRRALETLEADPARFRALDPPNRWGSYDTMLPYLRDFLQALERDVRGKVTVT